MVFARGVNQHSVPDLKGDRLSVSHPHCLPDNFRNWEKREALVNPAPLTSLTFFMNFKPSMMQNWTLSTKGRFLAPQNMYQLPVEVLQVLDSFIAKINKDSKNVCSFQFPFKNFPLFLIIALLGDFLWEGKKWEGQLFSLPGAVTAPWGGRGLASD